MDGSGCAGDAHSGHWHRQVSLLSREIIGEFEAETGRKITPGEFAENVTLEGVDLRSVCVMDRLVAGSVELEVTQIGKACHGDTCAIFREVGKCVMPTDGIFCRVLAGGVLRPGMLMTHEPRMLRFKVVTLSDRASAGEYIDRSGPRARDLTKEFFRGTRWRPEVDIVVLRTTRTGSSRS